MSGRGPDEIFCESCGEAIKKMAEVCPHCGVRNGTPAGAGGSIGTVGAGSSNSGSPHQDGIFEFSLKYPLSKDLTPVVVGGVLTLLSVLIVPAIALYGYSFRVGRAAARGDDQVPDYDDWGSLLKNGLLYILVFLPFAVVFSIGVSALVGIAAQLDPGPALYGVVLVGVLLSLIGMYVAGAILPTFVATGSVTETYREFRFVKVAFTKDFLVGFLVLFALNSIISTVISLVLMFLIFTFIGILLLIPLSLALLPLSAYMTYLTMSLWGYVAWDASGEGPFPRIDARDSLDAEL